MFHSRVSSQLTPTHPPPATSPPLPTTAHRLPATVLPLWARPVTSVPSWTPLAATAAACSPQTATPMAQTHCPASALQPWSSAPVWRYPWRTLTPPQPHLSPCTPTISCHLTSLSAWPQWLPPLPSALLSCSAIVLQGLQRAVVRYAPRCAKGVSWPSACS